MLRAARAGQGWLTFKPAQDADHSVNGELVALGVLLVPPVNLLNFTLVAPLDQGGWTAVRGRARVAVRLGVGQVE